VIICILTEIPIIMWFVQLLSRTGLWLYDLCVRQIAQETIPESVRGAVNGEWRSVIAFFDMGTYLLAIYFSGKDID